MARRKRIKTELENGARFQTNESRGVSAMPSTTSSFVNALPRALQAQAPVTPCWTRTAR